MIEVRRGADRFCTRTSWLTSWHSFSYGQWYDADNVGFGPLVALNHDVLAPGAGFEPHRHSGVDLVTYVVSGELAHRDSTGHSAVVGAGEVQVLSSGDGVTHSERNASDVEPVEYVQMWLRSDSPVARYGAPPLGPVAAGSALVVLPHGVLRHVVVPGDSGVIVGPGDVGHGRIGERALAYVLRGEVLLGRDRLRPGDAVLVSVSETGSAAAELRGLDRTSADAEVLAWSLVDSPVLG